MTATLTRILQQAATLALGCVISVGTLADASAQDWQLEEQDGDISAYTREMSNSPFLQIKATAIIDASASRVSALLGDGNGCAGWRAMCKSSKVLETVSEQERYVYMVLDLPWPLSDRDMVMHTLTRVDPQSRTATVDLQTDSERHPPKDYVRAESSGQFIIRMLSETQTEFTYIMHTDLGGDLPAGTVNGRLAESAVADLERLKKLAES